MTTVFDLNLSLGKTKKTKVAGWRPLYYNDKWPVDLTLTISVFSVVSRAMSTHDWWHSLETKSNLRDEGWACDSWRLSFTCVNEQSTHVLMDLPIKQCRGYTGYVLSLYSSQRLTASQFGFMVWMESNLFLLKWSPCYCSYLSKVETFMKTSNGTGLYTTEKIHRSLLGMSWDSFQHRLSLYM